MRELDYVGIFWTLAVGQVGNVCGGLGVRISLFVGQRSACGQAHRPFTLDSPSLRVTTMSPAEKLRCLGCAPRDQRRFKPQGIDVGERCGRNVRFSGVCGRSIVAVGYLSQISVRRIFGVTDPLYRVDLGFTYSAFRSMSYCRVTWRFLRSALSQFWPIGLFGLRQFKPGQKLTIADNTARHLILLLFILAGTLAWGFYLDHYELVYSTLGVVYGAGYAAAHVTRVVFWMMLGASILACALLSLPIAVRESNSWQSESVSMPCCTLAEYWLCLR